MELSYNTIIAPAVDVTNHNLDFSCACLPVVHKAQNYIVFLHPPATGVDKTPAQNCIVFYMDWMMFSKGSRVGAIRRDLPPGCRLLGGIYLPGVGY